MASDYEKIKIFSPPGYPNKITLYYRKSELSRNIYYYFSINKKPFRHSTQTNNLELAERYAMSRFLAIIKSKGEVRKRMKFDKLCRKFIEFKDKRQSEGKLALKTFIEYKRQVRFLVERFRDKEIDSFVKRDFNEYMDWRKEYYTIHPRKKRQVYDRNEKRLKGRIYNYSMETAINRELALLRSILFFAKNELELQEVKNIPTFEKYPENRGRDILTDEEVKKLQDYFENKNKYYWQILNFVANTAIRYPSEMEILKWKNIDIEKEYMSFERKGRRMTNRIKTLPIVGEAKEIIIQLKQRENIPKEKDDFVFVNDAGKQIKNIKKSYKKALNACGITGKHTVYSLRHYVTNKWMNQGIQPMIIAACLGHQSLAMIEKHYGKIMPRDTVKAMKEGIENQEIKDRERQEKLKKAREKEKMEKAFNFLFAKQGNP